MARKHGQPAHGEELPGLKRQAPRDVTEEVSELLAGYALGALPPEDTLWVEHHLAQRPAWQVELVQFERASTLLSYANPPQRVPVRARAGILARIDALEIESQERTLARSQPPLRLRERFLHRKRSVPKIAWAAAVPSTLLAIVFIMSSLVMQERISEQRGQLAAYQQEQSKANEVLLADNPLGQHVIELAQTSAAPLARGRLYVDRGANSAMLVVRDMPQPGDGQDYIVWVLTNTQNEEYARLGALEVDELGRGQMFLEPPDSFNHYLNVRITIESSDDVGTPSGPEVMTGGI